MALLDMVIDTNVLMHADNLQEARRQASIDLIKYLLDSTELLCLDKGFVMGDSNKSLIGAEYQKHLTPGGLGIVLLVKIFTSKRLKECPTSAPPNISNGIKKCVANKRDRTFLKVSFNSKSKAFVSHDFFDFSSDKRKFIKSSFGIGMMEACDVVSK